MGVRNFFPVKEGPGGPATRWERIYRSAKYESTIYGGNVFIRVTSMKVQSMV